MNVVYASSDLYSELATVSIVSLLENNRAMEAIRIFIIEDKICDLHKRQMCETVAKYGREIRFVSNVDVERLTNTAINVGRWHISTFSRLFLDRILPQDVRRVLYIDCDMMVRHSLAALWASDMGEAWVLGVDDCRGAMYRQDIGIAKGAGYINNGMILIDLAAWRVNNVEQLFCRFIEQREGNVTYMDQGVLNGVLQPLGRVGLLPVAFNAQTAFYDLGYQGLCICRNPVWAYPQADFERDIGNPTIVHFTTCFLSGSRPWFQKDAHPYRGEFLHYRSLTPWADSPLWADPTPAGKKLMTRVCQALPRPLMLACMRVLHSVAYPAARIVKRHALLLRRHTGGEPVAKKTH